MKQQLRKPENWQDFELLCKKLWGEIWQCAEIKRNGRQGQVQNGVDIYGVPKGEHDYYGIQCKGKDEYTHAQLTTTEVDLEIEKARTFSPTLRKFYFATTANKDVQIESYIRQKDLESRNNNGFEIHLFSWEDIVDLVDENRATHDWYVKQNSFRNRAAVEVVFDDGSTEITASPHFYKVQKVYLPSFTQPAHYRMLTAKNAKESRHNEEDWFNPQPVEHFLDGSTYNASCTSFKILVKNVGTEPIENYKIKFKVDGKYLGADSLDKQSDFISRLSIRHEYDVFYSEESKIFRCIPNSKILVANDSYLFDAFCIKPAPDADKLTINWELLSSKMYDRGQLVIKLNTKVIPERLGVDDKAGTGKIGSIIDEYYRNCYVSKEGYANLAST